MEKSSFKQRLPGYVASALCILVTSSWTLWGVIEMFHEGWYKPFEWLFFLLPAGACLTLTLLAITWPRIGGWLLVAIGGIFYAWQLWMGARRYGLSLGNALSWFLVSGVLALVGVLFLFEGRRRQRSKDLPDPRWWRRNLPYLLALGIPLLLGVALSIEPAIRVAGRMDDGDRGERTIVGNGVTLTWAPAGPGWRRSTDSLSWNEVALYGLPPVGLVDKRYGHDGQCNKDTAAGCANAADMQRYNVCRYLSADGTQLMAEPQNVWRMPTADELVRSLVRHGENAGCSWNGELGGQPCDLRPDKETPLWDPTSSVIYFWSADEQDAAYAYKVAYNSGVTVLLKFDALGSCGYRCVREP